MEHYIPKSALVAEIERRKKYYENIQMIKPVYESNIEDFSELLSFIDTLEVKESKLPNPRFPHLNNIVDKVFGAGNLESWEYEEAEQLVLLAKEELLKDLEVKEVNLDKELSYEDYKSFFEKYPDLSDDWGFDEAWIFANYFFELGIKAQKEE